MFSASDDNDGSNSLREPLEGYPDSRKFPEVYRPKPRRWTSPHVDPYGENEGEERLSLPSKQVPVPTGQQTRHVQPMLFYCWANVEDGGPTLKQHWFNISLSYLLGLVWSLFHGVVRSSNDPIMPICQCHCLFNVRPASNNIEPALGRDSCVCLGSSRLN